MDRPARVEASTGAGGGVARRGAAAAGPVRCLL